MGAIQRASLRPARVRQQSEARRAEPATTRFALADVAVKPVDGRPEPIAGVIDEQPSPAACVCRPMSVGDNFDSKPR